MARQRFSSLVFVSLCSLGLLAGGCATGGADGGTPAEMEVDDAAFAALGFRRVWTGFPTMTKNGRVREVYVDQTNIIVQETGSTVSVLEPDTGRLRWHELIGSATTKYISIYPYPWLGTPAVLVSSESDVYVLQADTGNLLARQNLAKVVNTGPVLVGDLAVYGTAGGEVMAHAFRAGNRIWGHDLDGPIEAGPTYVHGAIVAVAESGQIVSLDANSGSMYGRGEIFSGASTAPVAGDALFFVAGLDQSVWAFDPSNPGRHIWRYQTSAPLTVQPTAYAGALYVSTSDRGLVALEQRSGRVLWVNDSVQGEVIGMHRGKLLVFNADSHEAVTLSPASGIIYQRVSLGSVAGMAVDVFEDGGLFAWGEGGVLAKFAVRF